MLFVSISVIIEYSTPLIFAPIRISIVAGSIHPYSRYDNPLIHHHGEIHSLIGTLLFSYGFIGTILFLKIFNKFFRKENVNFLLCFVPVMFYNLAHNGIRNPLFWIVIVIIHYEIECFEQKRVPRKEL